jgi:hypothetical protein
MVSSYSICVLRRAAIDKKPYGALRDLGLLRGSEARRFRQRASRNQFVRRDAPHRATLDKRTKALGFETPAPLVARADAAIE